MATKNTIQQVQSFTGLNEAADGFRELALGEASVAVNWKITDGKNIKLRPGIRDAINAPGSPAALWAGYIRDRYYMISAIQRINDARTDVSILSFENGVFTVRHTQPIFHKRRKTVVKIFSLFDKVFVSVGYDMWSVDIRFDNVPRLEPEQPYIPLVVTGAAPAGGGDNLENLNILCDFARVQFSSDGEAVDYVLPTNAAKVTKVEVDNVQVKEAGTYNAETQTFTFTEAPVKGVNNVQITFEIIGSDLLEARDRFAEMPFCESYNGSTDSRLFFYGDGSNITYYTGVTEYGRASALYIPAMNEIAVDMSDSPITGATRHHSKLLFFKPDCCATVTYEPMTLADGKTIAAFTMRTIHKDGGNVPYGQVEIVNNNPRSISHGNLYEWVLPNVYATDERNAKVISDRVSRTLAAADMQKIVTLDDSNDTTYYIFLNDSDGTVLVNRYNLGTWVIYRSSHFKNVRYAAMYGSTPIFVTDDGGTTTIHYIDEEYRYDGTEPIKATWHTGYMDFKKDYQRKYSSHIWVSVLPEMASRCDITASTDRRDSYAVKQIGANIYNYGAVHYGYWTYTGKHAPSIRRIKLKVKKFTYYKLIFEINEPGANCTILGYDQKIRYGSEVK